MDLPQRFVLKQLGAENRTRLVVLCAGGNQAELRVEVRTSDVTVMLTVLLAHHARVATAAARPATLALTFSGLFVSVYFDNLVPRGGDNAVVNLIITDI